MFRRKEASRHHLPCFLSRLARDRRGNAMAIMAAFLIPLIGLSGSAVDAARLYVVKARLQQACDAGALAGRKAMTDTNPSTPLDATATQTANAFFSNNFRSGWFQNTNATFTPTKGVQGNANYANEVNGTASTQVPMTLLRFFGLAPVTIAVTCQAVFDTGDNDVMFVLDVTGSMSCYPSDPDSCATATSSFTRDDGTTGYYSPEKAPSGSTLSKLQSLRQAVTLFDTTMRSSADPSSHFRYGFVPYNSAVNVGGSIPSQYLQSTTWTYQSRQVNRDYNYGATSSVSLTGIPQSYCVPQRYPATGYSKTGPSWNTSYYQAEYYYNLTWSAANGGTCSGTQQPLRAVWRYQPYSLPLSQYVAGAAVANPSRLDGAQSKWRGCIEEVNTVAASSFSATSLPDDLNPDFIPSAASDMWRPMWPDAIWLRSSPNTVDVNDDQVNEASPQYYTDVTMKAGSPFDQYGYAPCPFRAQRLRTMTAQQVQDYVNDNDFRPYGGTYHDTGMIWGTRMLSPNGVFASDTTAWPGRPAPSRSIVFMTDGSMAPNPLIYGQYGVESLDLRVDGSTANMGSSPSWDSAYHAARFRAECDAAKARGITVYTVALGTAITSDLQYCASPGQSFSAYSTQQLTAAFQTIAQRVSMLRISQ
ncbi:TadE/TadG family type IV pilus assembly protein [Sphingomonas beigongshangi]|uniref:TadE/TadG family type IV pilus assembly protein n=1 Tax=Sphingomonas beigongshangi TaxID=2782540 RepID=UPI00193B01A2